MFKKLITNIFFKLLEDENFKEKIVSIVNEKITVLQDHIRSKVISILNEENVINDTLPLTKKQSSSVSCAIELAKEEVIDTCLEIIEYEVGLLKNNLKNLEEGIESVSGSLQVLDDENIKQNEEILQLKKDLAQIIDIVEPVDVKSEINKTRADVAKIIIGVKEDNENLKLQLYAFIDTISEKISEIMKKIKK